MRWCTWTPLPSALGDAYPLCARPNLIMLQSSEHLPITFTGCTLGLYFLTSAADQSDAFLLGMLISPPNWPQGLLRWGLKLVLATQTACVRLDHVYRAHIST